MIMQIAKITKGFFVEKNHDCFWGSMHLHPKINFVSVQQKAVGCFDFPIFPVPWGLGTKPWGYLQWSMSLYSFQSLNDKPSREIEFLTSLNTFGP